MEPLLLNSRKEYLNQEKSQIQKQLKSLPSDSFYISHQGKYSKWYTSSAGGSREYIPKSNRPYAEKLATAKYLELRLNDINTELSLLESLIEQHTNQTTNKLIKDPAYTELIKSDEISHLSNIDEWMSAEYNRNPYHPEGLVQPSPSGNILRSKSEALIDLLLTQHHIPYRYECELKLNDRITKYPDFTILHPRTGQIYYWEHLGRMSDPKYVRDNLNKLMDYIDNSIIPGQTLILTFETQNQPISADVVNKTIELYFG